MPEENTKRCPLISQFFLTSKPSAFHLDNPNIGGEPMPFIGFCLGEGCGFWASRVADDGGVREGCCFKLLAEK